MLDKISDTINLIAESIVSIIETPMKAAITTITGLVTGYIPMTVNNLSNIANTDMDKGFQHFVWTITSVVAITAIISWIQKQRDRWLKNHPKQNKNLFNIADDDDEDKD